MLVLVPVLVPAISHKIREQSSPTPIRVVPEAELGSSSNLSELSKSEMNLNINYSLVLIVLSSNYTTVTYFYMIWLGYLLSYPVPDYYLMLKHLVISESERLRCG